MKHYFLKKLGYKRWDDALDDYLKLRGKLTWDEFYEQRKTMENQKSQKIKKIKIPRKPIIEGFTEI